MIKLVSNVKALHLGYEELHQLSCQTVVLMTTDSAEYESVGIDQSEKVDLQELTDSFNNRDFDEKYSLIQKLKTETKNQKVQELVSNIYKFENIFGVQWSKLGFNISVSNLGSLSQDNDLKLLSKAKAFVNAVSNLNIIDKQSETYLALEQSIIDLAKAIEGQQTAMIERKIATEMRTAQAFELFHKVRRIREFGKRMWQLKGEKARSDAYLMPRSKPKQESSASENEIEVLVDEQLIKSNPYNSNS